MFKIAKPLFLICETPLHAGSGDALGVVDLPIQRERHTGFPKIEASSLKGAIREAFEGKVINKEKQFLLDDSEIAKNLLNYNKSLNEKWITLREQKEVEVKDKDGNTKNKYLEAVSGIFGPEEDEAKSAPHSGAIAFTDARLLFFPVKSMKGVYAYVTCPQILEKFLKEMNLTNEEKIPSLPNQNTVPKKSGLLVNAKNIILEEYTFKIEEEEEATSKFAEWISKKLFSNSPEMNYWKNKLATDIVVLSNDDFKDMVNLFTEVITRTKINNETGTVLDGALFTEEYLPQESILYSLVMASPIFKEKGSKGIFESDGNGEKEANLVMDFFTNGLQPVFQLGGNSTLGKGLLRKVF